MANQTGKGVERGDMAAALDLCRIPASDGNSLRICGRTYSERLSNADPHGCSRDGDAGVVRDCVIPVMACCFFWWIRRFSPMFHLGQAEQHGAEKCSWHPRCQILSWGRGRSQQIQKHFQKHLGEFCRRRTDAGLQTAHHAACLQNLGRLNWRKGHCCQRQYETAGHGIGIASTTPNLIPAC